ncbi:MAG: methyltransferase [Desulfurococcales archaeon]|nr:methyltransferase [Desulfurococcales archaeon]
MIEYIVEREYAGFILRYVRHTCVYEPADDTYMLANFLIELWKNGYAPSSILELGAGSGFILSLVQNLWPDAILHATEINPYAVEGLRKLGFNLFHCEFDRCIPKNRRYDLGISNPPYLPPTPEKVLACEGWLEKAWTATPERHLEFCISLARRAKHILMITSSLIGGPGNILQCLQKGGFEGKVVREERFFYETLYLVEGIPKNSGNSSLNYEGYTSGKDASSVSRY